jgi:hypothetical protein
MNNPSPECLAKKNIGPVVPGNYTILSSEVDRPGFLRNLVRQLKGDWGSFRVPLHPDAATQADIAKLGRTGNFFIHGGAIEGSAGCIDCGGGLTGNRLTDSLYNDLATAPGGKATLEVFGRVYWVE